MLNKLIPTQLHRLLVGWLMVRWVHVWQGVLQVYRKGCGKEPDLLC